MWWFCCKLSLWFSKNTKAKYFTKSRLHFWVYLWICLRILQRKFSSSKGKAMKFNDMVVGCRVCGYCAFWLNGLKRCERGQWPPVAAITSTVLNPHAQAAHLHSPLALHQSGYIPWPSCHSAVHPSRSPTVHSHQVPPGRTVHLPRHQPPPSPADQPLSHRSPGGLEWSPPCDSVQCLDTSSRLGNCRCVCIIVVVFKTAWRSTLSCEEILEMHFWLKRNCFLHAYKNINVENVWPNPRVFPMANQRPDLQITVF